MILEKNEKRTLRTRFKIFSENRTWWLTIGKNYYSSIPLVFKLLHFMLLDLIYFPVW